MEHVSFRTPHKKKLVKIAEEEDLTVSEIINDILEKALRKKKTKK